MKTSLLEWFGAKYVIYSVLVKGALESCVGVVVTTAIVVFAVELVLRLLRVRPRLRITAWLSVLVTLCVARYSPSHFVLYPNDGFGLVLASWLTRLRAVSLDTWAPLHLFVLLGFYFAGVIVYLVCLRLAQKHFRAKRLPSLALEASPAGLLNEIKARGICVKVVADACPEAIGQTIILPTQAMTWTPQTLETVLRHELSHIRRNHFWLLAAALVPLLLMPYNLPLIWAVLQLRKQCEFDCDNETAKAQGIDAYSDAFAEVRQTLTANREHHGIFRFPAVAERIAKLRTTNVSVPSWQLSIVLAVCLCLFVGSAWAFLNALKAPTIKLQLTAHPLCGYAYYIRVKGGWRYLCHTGVIGRLGIAPAGQETLLAARISRSEMPSKLFGNLRRTTYVVPDFIPDTFQNVNIIP
jgi:Zn-dependent protease with chaperone function